MVSLAKTWVMGSMAVIKGPKAGRVQLQSRNKHHHTRYLTALHYKTRYSEGPEDDCLGPQQSGATEAAAAAAVGEETFPVSCETCQGSSYCLNFMDPQKAGLLWGLRPLLIGSTLFGLTHTRKRGAWFKSPSYVYSAVVCLFLWGNFARLFANYKEDKYFGTKLFMKITVHVFYGQVAVSTTVFLTHISPRLPGFFKVWDVYNRQQQCRTAQYLRVCVNRYLLMVSIFILALLTCSILLIIFESPYVESPASQFLLSTHNTESLGLRQMRILQGVMAVFVTYAAVIWIWPTAMLAVICSGLRHNYKRISIHIAKNFKSMDVVSLEKTRRRHQSLCRIVKLADEIFSFYNLLMYLTAVPLICFAIYNFAFRTSDDATTMGLITSLVHMLSLSAQVGIMTAAASSLCRQAVAPKEELLDVHFEVESEACHQKGIQVMLFLHRLSHSHIGLTAWNLFNITKTTIMTVVTMILSNVFVLIKFGLTLEPIASGNCSAH